MARSEASSLSSAEVGRLWEEPTEETSPKRGSVGILAAFGAEDVNCDAQSKNYVRRGEKFGAPGFPIAPGLRNTRSEPHDALLNHRKAGFSGLNTPVGLSFQIQACTNH